MEPFRIIPTRRLLRSSRRTQAGNQKGDQLGILGEKPKVASPHPDPNTLAKEMEEFEKLMHLGSEETSDQVINSKAPELDIPLPTVTVSEHYEPEQPTEEAEPYEPEEPTAMDDEYTPDEPTLPVDEVQAPAAPSITSSEVYDPDQPTEEEKMVTGEVDVLQKGKTEVAEVEADMPQLALDSGQSGNTEDKSEVGKGDVADQTETCTNEKVSKKETNSESISTSEQENLLPEVWLRKKEKKKKKHSSHGKHKKPLVEWRMGVLRKDYVRKDLSKFPVDEKLMATTKHKWNDDSEIEHLKLHGLGDGDLTDASEVSGMISPANMTSDTDPDTEQDISTEMETDAVEHMVDTAQPSQSSDAQNISISDSDSKPCISTDTQKIEEKRDAALDEENVPDSENINEKTNKESVEEKEDENEMDVAEKEEKTSRVSTRQSRRRSGMILEDTKETESKGEKKEKETGRRRSLRNRDDTDDEKEIEKTEILKESEPSRRRSRRSERNKDESSGEGHDAKQNTTEPSKAELKEEDKKKDKQSDRHRDNLDNEKKSDKKGVESKVDKSEEDSGRRRSRRSTRHKEEYDDERKDKRPSESKADKQEDSSERRTSRRSTRRRENSEDERRKRRSNSRERRSDSKERRRSTSRERKRSASRERRRSASRERRRSNSRERNRSDSRERRRSSSRERRSDSRESRRYRDDESRYDRYGRDYRRSDRSRERSEDRRYRDSDRRRDKTDSRERDDRRESRRGKSEDRKSKERIHDKDKSNSKAQDNEKKNVKEENCKSEVTKSKQEKDKVHADKDQSVNPNSSDQAPNRLPVKFNITSRMVRRSTRSAVKAKVGVFGDDEEDEDDIPLSDLKDTKEEKETDKTSSKSSEEHVTRVTRSKSRDGQLVANTTEERHKSQSPPVLFSEVLPSGSDTSGTEAPCEIPLRKELRKDAQESESDSGAEFGLMTLGDEAPRLYPESILHSQLEMELLANAFCSTDTEAETDTDKGNENEKVPEFQTAEQKDTNKDEMTTSLEEHDKPEESKESTSLIAAEECKYEINQLSENIAANKTEDVENATESAVVDVPMSISPSVDLQEHQRNEEDATSAEIPASINETTPEIVLEELSTNEIAQEDAEIVQVDADVVQEDVSAVLDDASAVQEEIDAKDSKSEMETEVSCEVVEESSQEKDGEQEQPATAVTPIDLGENMDNMDMKNVPVEKEMFTDTTEDSASEHESQDGGLSELEQRDTKISEYDTSKTESESDMSGMEIIDLMDGTSYRASASSVLLPSQVSDADAIVPTAESTESEAHGDQSDVTLDEQTPRTLDVQKELVPSVSEPETSSSEPKVVYIDSEMEQSASSTMEQIEILQQPDVGSKRKRTSRWGIPMEENVLQETASPASMWEMAGAETLNAISQETKVISVDFFGGDKQLPQIDSLPEVKTEAAAFAVEPSEQKDSLPAVLPEQTEGAAFAVESSDPKESLPAVQTEAAALAVETSDTPDSLPKVKTDAAAFTVETSDTPDSLPKVKTDAAAFTVETSDTPDSLPKVKTDAAAFTVETSDTPDSLPKVKTDAASFTVEMSDTPDSLPKVKTETAALAVETSDATDSLPEAKTEAAIFALEASDQGNAESVPSFEEVKQEPKPKRKRKSRWDPVETTIEQVIQPNNVIPLQTSYFTDISAIAEGVTDSITSQRLQGAPDVHSSQDVTSHVHGIISGDGTQGPEKDLQNSILGVPETELEENSSPTKRPRVEMISEIQEDRAEKSASSYEVESLGDAAMDASSQESYTSRSTADTTQSTDGDSDDRELSPTADMEMDGAGDHKPSTEGALPEMQFSKAMLTDVKIKAQKLDITEEISTQGAQKETLPSTGSGEDAMEEGELATEVKVEKEESWDESCGKEQGEIEDDDEDVVGSRPHRRSRRISLEAARDKENIPQDDYLDRKREERERPKEESRESREERRRKQYEEWGIVERSKIPKFVELDENYYLTERRRSKAGKEARRMVCICTTSREERRRGEEPCGEDCLNRVLMIECGSRCPCGDYCTNKRFQRREYGRVGVFHAPGKGHGLKAKVDLKDNAFVMEYVGEVLNPSEFRQRAKIYSKDKNLHFYFMALKSDEIIDATEKGNSSRFMNHSCDPNCETQKWTVNGQLRVGFFTKRPVKAGTELTFDYQFEVYGQEAQKCLCGSEKCRGVIGKQKKQKEGKDTTPKRRGSMGEKRRKETFADITLEDEIQQMVDELDEMGLQTNDQTIALSRLMVRADQAKQRLALLKILQETLDTTYLKYFLTHHGLRLLWSWMVDLGENPRELQLQILLTLSQLPIPNKNILEDSKVMSVIERWSRDIAKEEINQDSIAAIKNESDVDSSSASEAPSRSDTPVSAVMATSSNLNKSIEALKSIAEATSSESDLDSDVAVGKSAVVDQSGDADDSESPSSTENDMDTSEKPSSTAKGEMDDSNEDSSRQPDSASDAAITRSSKDESSQEDPGESKAQDGEGDEAQAVHSTDPSVGESSSQTEDQKDESRSPSEETEEASATVEPSVVEELVATGETPGTEETSASEEHSVTEEPSVTEENSVTKEASAADQVQSSDTVEDKPNSTDQNSESSTTIESAPKLEEERTSSIDQPEAEVAKDTNNEAESKSDSQPKSSSSGLANIIATLLDSWSDLKEIYRIPKKENDKDRDKAKDRDHDSDRHRDHDRDRDRRDRDRDRDRHRDRDRRDRDRGRDRDDRHSKDRSRDSDRDRHRDRDRDLKDRDKDDKSRRKRSRSRSKERETKSSWSKDSDSNATPPKLRKPWKDSKVKEEKDKDGKGKEKEGKGGGDKEGKKLSKEERRQQFALEVEAKEREDAARREQEALMMAQWQEQQEQQMAQEQQQMAQFVDANGFPMDPNAPGMMLNEHGMPIEVIPGHMGMPPVEGMPMGEPYMEHMHPDMQGQYPEHMHHPEHMGMEEGYPQPHPHPVPHMNEHPMMQPHPDAPPMYDDRGYPIPPPEQYHHPMMGMPHPEAMQQHHPGMEYGMNPSMNPEMEPAMMQHHHMEPDMGQQSHPGMDPHMMGAQPHPAMMGPPMDHHIQAMQQQPQPVDPSMLPPDHLLHPQGEMMPPHQEMHVPQVVPIPEATPAQLAAQPAPSEQELMPPPTLPAPSRKPKKTKAPKQGEKTSTTTAKATTTYVAPATPSSSTSPVLQPGQQQYPPQQQAQPPVQAGLVPVSQPQQVLPTPVLPQAPQQVAQTTYTFVTPDGMLVTQTITPLATTEQAHLQQMQQHVQMGQQQQQVTESIPSPPAKPKTAKLPPKWKSAQDAEGKTYYYHSITRETQWEPPMWDEEVDGPYDDEPTGGSNTPTYDEKSKQKTTTAPADTSSEAAKKLKEAFRSKMSHHVVGYLNVYRKPECKSGRITNTEDFKHLARKLTHGIMAKELKHCRNIEDLEVNENVKHKAKEYIKKYMARYGKVYKKDQGDIDI